MEVLMSAAAVLRFSENFDKMTYPECLSFIARSRRQIDQLERRATDEADRQELTSIRRGLADLEARIHARPDRPVAPS